MAAGNVTINPLDRLLEGLTTDWVPDLPFNNIGVSLLNFVELNSGNAVAKLTKPGEQALFQLYGRVIRRHTQRRIDVNVEKTLFYACGSYINTRNSTSNIKIFSELFISELSDCAEVLESLTKSLLDEAHPAIEIVYYIVIATLHLTLLQEMYMISLLGNPNAQSAGYSAATKLMEKAAQHCSKLSTIHKKIQDDRLGLISGVEIKSTTLDSEYVETTGEFIDSIEGTAYNSTEIGTSATQEEDVRLIKHRMEKRRMRYIVDSLDKLNTALLDPEKVIFMWRQLEETPPGR